MPWELVDEIYAQSMSMEKGREAIPSRIAFGAVFIKEQENLTDEGTVTYLSENPYAQYFVGLKEFRTEPLFEASMMVHFRKRFGPAAIREINEILYERMCPREKEPPEGRDGTASEGNSGAGMETDGNKGVMILDATVAPADIHYPTDLSLVNACREDTEKMIDRLKAAAQRYRERVSRWPEAILADTIYRNRENRTFCKEHGIRLSGPRLGRPRKGVAEEDKAQAYRDSVERNVVESRNGIAKRRYGLDRMMAYLAVTGLTEAAMQFLVMNVAHLLRFLLCLFWRRQARLIRPVRWSPEAVWAA